jgi:hypothetical protein
MEFTKETFEIESDQDIISEWEEHFPEIIKQAANDPKIMQMVKNHVGQLKKDCVVKRVDVTLNFHIKVADVISDLKLFELFLDNDQNDELDVSTGYNWLLIMAMKDGNISLTEKIVKHLKFCFPGIPGCSQFNTKNDPSCSPVVSIDYYIQDSSNGAMFNNMVHDVPNEQDKIKMLSGLIQNAISAGRYDIAKSYMTSKFF